MIDFVLAGLLYILLMFFAFSLLSFVTIGLAYTVISGLRRYFHMFRQTSMVLNQSPGTCSAVYFGVGKRN